MMDLKSLVRSSRASEPMCTTEKAAKAGGVILLVLTLLGLYFMLPEIRRYLRIERM